MSSSKNIFQSIREINTQAMKLVPALPAAGVSAGKIMFLELPTIITFKIRYFFISALIFIFLFSPLWGSANSDINKSKENMVELQIIGLKNLDKEKLAENLGVEKHAWFAFWDKKRDTIPEKFLSTLSETIRGYLDSEGYYNAKFSVKRVGKRVIVKIDERKPVKVTEIEIKSDENLSNIISWKIGDIFKAQRFVDIKEKLGKQMLLEGYCRYSLDAKAYVDLVKHGVGLRYILKRGKLCHFSDINISKKPDSINKDVIISRLRFKKGEKFSSKKIEDSYRALNRLDVFSEMQINTKNTKGTDVETVISLGLKNKLHRYLIGVGYQTDIGFRIRGEYEKRNFMGGARKLSLNTELSRKTQKIEAKLFWPAFIGIYDYYLDLYSKVGYAREETDAYLQKRLYFDTHLQYEYEKWQIQFGIGIEQLNLKLYEKEPSLIEGKFSLFYPYWKVVYDGRDSKLDPKNGYYLSAYGEYGLANTEGGSQYLKYILEGRAIHSWGDLTLAAVGKVGWIHEIKGSLPASKLFNAGGAFSNRAYALNELGVTLSRKTARAIGGKTWVNFSLEADYKLFGPVYGAVFWDSTMISAKENDFKAPFVHAAGIGIRYKTPVGPLKVDIGINPFNPSHYAISIMLGQSF